MKMYVLFLVTSNVMSNEVMSCRWKGNSKAVLDVIYIFFSELVRSFLNVSGIIDEELSLGCSANSMWIEFSV